MTETKRVKVVIDPLGNPTVEAINFFGVGCEAATAPIEKALAGGAGGVTRVMKPEWGMAEVAGEQEENKLTW